MDQRDRQSNTDSAAQIKCLAPITGCLRKVPTPVLWVCLVAGGLIMGANWRPSAAADANAQAKSDDSGYAAAYLQLAEAQLAYAEQMNRLSPGTFSQEQLVQYRKSLEISQNLAKQEQLSGKFDRMVTLADWAELKSLQAQAEVTNAETINRQVPGTISNERIKELKAYAALAKLDANAGQAALKANPDGQLRWRIRVLEDELIQLRKEVALDRARQ